MRILLTLIAVMMAFPSVAHAYIDPGSGSALISAIIGFFVVIGLGIKSFWYKIKAFFTGKKPDSDSEE